MKTAIVLTPSTMEELEQKLKTLSEDLEDVDYEVVAVMEHISMEDYQWVFNYPKLICVELMNNQVSNIHRQCIGRYLVSEKTDSLLFLDMDKDISKEDFEKRVKFLGAEQLIGVVGDVAGKPDEFVMKTSFHKMLGLLNIDKKEFDKRCRDDKGEVRHVKPDCLLTSIDMWDRVGGFSVTSEAPCLEYCLRVQTLGYTILPLTI